MQYIPSKLQIETVNRFCNARCGMCTIKFLPDFEQTTSDDQSYRGTARKAEIMSLETFKIIAAKFEPFAADIKVLDLYGCGEPLMDRTLPEKISFAKSVGFKEIGFTSNCGLLRKDLAHKLLEAGLTCIIPSIDGTTAEVHEAIRPRTHLDEIIENVKYFIKARDEGDHKCRILVRMIRQQLNRDQWDEYREFWSALLDSAKGDRVLQFDIHNTGGKIEGYDAMKVDGYERMKEKFDEDYKTSNAGVCPDLFSRLIIFASGDVGLCAADQAEYFKLGNVLNEDPMEIFNNKQFSEYREKWLGKKYMDLKYCRDCTIAISRYYKSNHALNS